MTAIFEVINGPLYRWDTKRKIAVSPINGETVNEVHFAHEGTEDALRVAVKNDADGKYVDVPNILLQRACQMRVWAVVHTADGRQTVYSAYQRIHDRARPDDYVYTETEILDYQTLSDKVDALAEKVENITVGNVEIKTDETLSFVDGLLSVNTTNDMEQDNTRPITSAGVFATVGNIEALLKTI